MKKGTIKISLMFITGLMVLIGCGKDVLPEERLAEEQLPDVSDNIAATISENAEINDTSEEERREVYGEDTEGEFYPSEGSIQSAIMDGDFSSMRDVEFRETVEQQYQWWEESRAIEEMEWRLVDLNGDGIDDLILQEVQTVGESQQHRIVAIFALKEDSASCELWDLNDGTEYSFCGSTGELMYTAPYSGTAIAGEPYWHYYYDSEWNKIRDFVLTGTVVDSSMDGSREEFLQYHQEFIEAHPDMAEDGVYYSRHEIDIESGEQKEREALTFEEFKEIFEEVMGMEYYGRLSYYD